MCEKTEFYTNIFISHTYNIYFPNFWIVLRKGMDIWLYQFLKRDFIS